MQNTYLIAILLPNEIREQISRIQERFRVPRWRKRIDPHITLLPPFTTAKDVRSITKRITSVSRQHQVFMITLQGIGRFTPRHHVIFAHIQAAPELQRLHMDLSAALKDMGRNRYELPGNFHPHVTLSNKLTPEEADIQFSEIAKLNIHQQFLCKSITLFRLDEQNIWQAVADFKLTQTQES